MIDSMIEGYVCWREACATAALTYERWSGAGRSEKALAFGAYLAASDQEELAAGSYRRLIEQMALIR